MGLTDGWGSECKGKYFCEGCLHGAKHRGRLVGGWFVVIEGEVEHMPKDRSISKGRFPLGNPENLPTWKRILEGHAYYNTQHLWCCETCFVEHSTGPDAFDAPRETYMYPTCFAGVELCVGLGADNVGHLGGLCGVPERATA